MLADLFKSLNSSLEDVLKNAEAGEGTIKDNMDDLSVLTISLATNYVMQNLISVVSFMKAVLMEN